MRSKYISDFVENDAISEVFLIDEKSLGTTRAGKPYINLNLRDKTGSISAKVWDDADVIFKQLGSSDFVEVSGKVERYQNRLQIKVGAIRSLKSDKIEMTDFLATTEEDVDEMFDELEKICSTVGDKYFQQLLQRFLSDDEFVRKLKKAPAAKMIHHSFIGGLLEHTLSVMRICDMLTGHYRELIRDLVITGAFFHDIGKIDEIESEKGFNYTREGNLIGHVIIGYRMVEEAISEIKDFPDKLCAELGHMILSHQGKLEFGAPVVPMFAEAILLHYADDLDVKISVFKKVVESNRNTGSEFTDRVWELDTRVYKEIEKRQKD